MSTRAVYGFQDNNSPKPFWVYVHCDGYPTGAADKLADFIKAELHWPLWRFDAADAAAAFVAANKKCPGNTYLSHGPQDHGDICYAYLVTVEDDAFKVKAYNKGFSRIKNAKPFWDGNLSVFIDNAELIEKQEAA